MAKMTRNQKLVIGGVVAGAVVLVIVLATRKAKAAPGREGGKVPGEGSGVFIPPLPGGYELPTLQAVIPEMTPTNEIPEGITSSAQTGMSDPLKAAGWHWGYLGGVNPSEFYAMGDQLALGDLPFSMAAVKQITPLSNVTAAFYLGPGEALVQGYYIMGPLKAGFGFTAGSWGLVEVWNPSWHGY